MIRQNIIEIEKKKIEKMKIQKNQKKARRIKLKKEDFQLQRDSLYRELLRSLTQITNHPVVQCQIGLRDACVEIAKNYRKYNDLVDEMVR